MGRGGTDFRLAIPAVAAWVAAALAIALPGVPLWALVAAWALAIGLVVTRRRPLVLAGVCCAAVALVCSVVGMRAGERHPDLLLEAATASRHVTATATLTSTIVPSSEFFAATITTATVGRSQLSASIPVLVFADAPADRIGIGATLTIDGTVQAAAFEDDVAFLFFANEPPVITGDPPWMIDWGNDLRERFADDAASLPGDGGALLPGLAIGDTSAVSDDLDLAMKGSALSHLTAVSGANCAVVVGLTLLVAAAAGLRRATRIAVATVVLLAFVVLVTPEPSVLRAGVMATLVLGASLSGRGSRGIPLLATAVIVLLAIDPWLARNYGFVLSVIATGALLTLAGPLARLIARWLPLPVAAVLAVPLAAQLACQPVLILLNSTIPVYGIVANVLAEPAAPIGTVVGLLACALLPVTNALGIDWIAHALAWVAWVPAAWIAAVARFFSALPGNNVPWLAGAPGLAVLAVLTAAGLVAVLGRRRGVRVVAASVSVLLVVVMGAAAVGTRIADALTRPQDWQIAACDIGQGDAVLVRSEGVVALVDTGPSPDPLAECLRVLDISRIDLLVLSHYDLDHVGGVEAVVGMVDHALVGPTGNAGDEALLDDLRGGGASIEEASRGRTGVLGDLRWNVLWPKAPLRGIEPGNDASVTMAFAGTGCACLSALFTGDLGELAQSLVLAAGGVPTVDVFKVAHHGSADQDPRLYEVAHATVGIISVGVDNDYGHPTDELLEVLETVGTRAVRTDTGGMVLLKAGPSPGTVVVWTQRDGGDG
jgi:competence protein ComEC